MDAKWASPNSAAVGFGGLARTPASRSRTRAELPGKRLLSESLRARDRCDFTLCILNTQEANGFPALSPLGASPGGRGAACQPCSQIPDMQTPGGRGAASLSLSQGSTFVFSRWDVEIQTLRPCSSGYSPVAGSSPSRPSFGEAAPLRWSRLEALCHGRSGVVTMRCPGHLRVAGCICHPLIFGAHGWHSPAAVWHFLGCGHEEVTAARSLLG